MSIIVVTGTPGTGKTTFSQELSKLIKYKYVSANDEVISNKLYIEYDDKTRTFIVDIDKAKRFVNNKYTINNFVFDGHIAHLIVDKNLLEICVVLRCSPYQLKNRLVNKGYNKEKIIENVQAEILDVIYVEAIETYGYDNVIQIDVTGNIKEKVHQFIDMWKIGKYTSETVDWLTLIYQKNDLKSFFPAK